MAIITRDGKGAPLTHTEMDQNLIEFRDGVNAKTPKERDATGIKIGPDGSETYGWNDNNGSFLFDPTDPNSATMVNYRGNIRQLLFAETDQITVNFHMPHDYVMGTDIFVHVHWSHTSSTLTGGSITWGFETMSAKGFDQEAFAAPKIISVAQTANLTPYQHMIAEGAMSVSGGSPTQLDSDLLETDGIIFCNLVLDSNDLTDSVSGPDVFVHFVDIHYQATGISATKNKAPDFWT